MLDDIHKVRIVELAKSHGELGFIDYRESYDDFNYDKISSIIFPNEDNEDERYDFFDDEYEACKEIFKTIKKEFPKNFSDEDEDTMLEIREISIDHFKYIDTEKEFAKNSGSRWFKIELPYYRESFSACEKVKSWNDMNERDRYVTVIESCFKKMGLADSKEFAEVCVKRIESYLNLEYSNMYYDYPLAFYSRIELTDLLEIVRSPGTIYTLNIPAKTEFGITDDGGATERTERTFNIDVVFVPESEDAFLTIIDGGEKFDLNSKDRIYSIQSAYLSSFYGDDLCGLCYDAVDVLEISKKIV